MIEPKNLLIELFQAAVDAAHPEQKIVELIPPAPRGKTIVVGAGKGSAQMAMALENAWKADGRPALKGVVVTRYGYGCDCADIEILEASHPVPDEAGLVASNRLLQAVEGLAEDDLVIALISGGGSSLLPAPPEGLQLGDEIDLNQKLLASGAPISAMNTVRKQLSRIKGGRLAQAAHPARVFSLIVSDIPGDNPAHVASGPTIPDTCDAEMAREVVERYQLDLPSAVKDHLAKDINDFPSPDSRGFQRDEMHIIASARVSLQSARAKAGSMGVNAVILSDSMEGESREVARVHGAIAREIAGTNHPFTKPVVLLSGGETTVTLRGKGKGGRNTEFLLSLAMELDGMEGVFAMAADTDGIDGSEDNAGAFCDGTSIFRMRQAGLDPLGLLIQNDAWTAFQAIGDIFKPGPTGTNVNDFRAIFIQ